MRPLVNKKGIFSLLLIILFVFSGCASLVSKGTAFPGMYSDIKPLTLLVVPAINKTTSADASDYLNVTVTQPLANAGYYVLPMPIVSEIFKNEGIVDGEQVTDVKPQLFKETFGADAVLFLTISQWDKIYLVLAGNVEVGLDYKMLSTKTGDVLWSYSGTVIVNTSGNSSSGNPLADLIANTIITAMSTAATRYVDVASMVHAQVLLTLPKGDYNPKSGADSSERVVDLDKILSNVAD